MEIAQDPSVDSGCHVPGNRRLWTPYSIPPRVK